MELDLPDIEEYIVPEYTNNTCATLFKRTQDAGGEWKDVTLVAGIDQKRVRAHRLIVSTANPYFDAMLMGDMREAREDIITLANVDGATLRALIRFCYLGRIDISDNVEVLLAAASGMELVQVEKLCERYCLKRLSRENCLHLWLLADRYSLAELKKKAFAVALDSFSLLVGSAQFLQLEMKPLQLLLADDNLCVACEEDVIEAVVGWVRSDEDNRKEHFAELVNSVVRVTEMKTEFFARELFKYCMEWSSAETYAKLMKTYQDTPNAASSRFSIRHPTPMIIGTDTNKDRDLFTIEKFSHLQKDVVEVVNFAGYRSGHSAVQTGQHLYILGGKDTKGIALNRVQRVNIRDWTSEDMPPMRLARAHFASVHLDGSVYAIGANFDASSSENVNLSVERYDIANSEWSDVPELDLFGRAPRQIHAIAFAGRIAVIYTGGMSLYDPMWNKWHQKAGIPQLTSEAACDLYIWERQLMVNYRLIDGSGRYRSKYVASDDKWTTQRRYHQMVRRSANQVCCDAVNIRDHLREREHT